VLTRLGNTRFGPFPVWESVHNLAAKSATGTWLTEEKPICVSRRRSRLAGRGVTKETVWVGLTGLMAGWTASVKVEGKKVV
jgi:hypothetical protein